MQHLNSLKHHLLIAMPHLNASRFASAVIYLCEYNADGAMGLVLNHPLDVTFQDVCEQLELPLLDASYPAILAGGPVNTEHGFILHRERGDWQSTLEIASDAHLTTSKDILEAIAAGHGPRQYHIALGYAGWSAKQLDQELLDNSWLTLEASTELLFETAPTELYAQALAQLGVSLEFLSTDTGHA